MLASSTSSLVDDPSSLSTFVSVILGLPMSLGLPMPLVTSFSSCRPRILGWLGIIFFNWNTNNVDSNSLPIDYWNQWTLIGGWINVLQLLTLLACPLIHLMQMSKRDKEKHNTHKSTTITLRFFMWKTQSREKPWWDPTHSKIIVC